jgi:hypothetical protein
VGAFGEAGAGCEGGGMGLGLGFGAGCWALRAGAINKMAANAENASDDFEDDLVHAMLFMRNLPALLLAYY